MADFSDHDVTQMLGSASSGDSEASRRLFELVYEELRRMARAQMRREDVGHSLRPTELVHEAYLRIVGVDDMCWRDRGHFYATAAQAMRRLLVDHARRRNRQKRGGGRRPLPIDAVQLPTDRDLDEILALDDALDRLSEFDPRLAGVFGLRVFAGLSVEETARALGISPATVKRDWGVARAWLVRSLEESSDGCS